MNNKKRYNWKARQIVNTVVDNSETKKIQLELNCEGNYDQSNLLVLPAQKRKTKKINDKKGPTRILSKKQRKKLEKIVDRKAKKSKRAELLDKLSQVQATTEELNQLTSISSVQTKGLKRHFSEQKTLTFEDYNFDFDDEITKGEPTNEKIIISTIKGSKKRKIDLNLHEKKVKSDDPNIVGFDSSASSSDTESEQDELEEESNKKEELRKEPVQENRGTENNKNENSKNEVSYKNNAKVNQNSQNEVRIERKPAIHVRVIRDPEIQKSRLKLPILGEEQQIMETINENSVVIIAGETGSGKTTQVPQFLYEAGYSLEKQIAVTEPRRVAAISMSKRVGEEMNLTSNEISYLIRFEGNVTEQTKIKFMTDGVLLREVQKDFLLRNYSVIILDEAHERSVYTDILMGLLSRIVPLRNKKGIPLKLIIMSATLRLQDFTENRRLFKKTPLVINVDARQFPVTIYFSKRTNENYLKEAFLKACKIHTERPQGGILIFVTGQQEVNLLVKKLRNAFPFKSKHIYRKQDQIKRKKRRQVKFIPEINLDDYSLPDQENSEGEEEEISSEDEIDLGEVLPDSAQPLWVLPLYSMLSSQKQSQVFEAPPEGCRLCVVSTNVAETSLTIPNIKYVIDTGKTKVKLYDKVTGVTTYAVTWTSKASASQRAGRAGRTEPGHCYRLYSSAVFNDVFQQYDTPEIQKKPVDDLYLQMKCMNIDKIANFPFPTAPDMLQLNMAENRLTVLGAIKDGKVTPLGRAISKFPVLPRFGKMLALSHQQGLLPYTICMVAAFSVQEVLIETPTGDVAPDDLKNVRQKWMSVRRKWAGTGNSLLLGDAMVLLKAVGAAEYANSEGKLEKFCTENGLRHKAVIEIRKLRIQLTNEIKMNMKDVNVIVDPKMKPPSNLQAKLLRQILLSGMGDRVAKKITPDDLKEGEDKAKFKYAYRTNGMEEPIYMHQGSVLRKTFPEYVIYQEIYETNKMYMRGVTAIESEWLPVYVASMSDLNPPLSDPEPYYNSETDKIYCYVSGSFGSHNWPISNVKIEYPETLNAYRWFSKFLLEGKVFPKLEKYKNDLLATPNAMIKSWAKLQPRVSNILRMLAFKQARSKVKLEEIWRNDPKFLLSEYLNWVPQSAYGEVTLIWPPL